MTDDDYTPELPPLDAYERDLDPTATNGHLEPAPVSTPQRSAEGGLADGHRPTDAGNADRLAARITRPAQGPDADGLARWIPAWGKWIVYSDGAWRLDHGDARIMGEAKTVARTLFTHAAALDGDDRKKMWAHANKSESSAAISSMIRLARSDTMVDHTDLDQRHHLLNVRNGTIDLATGQLRAHDPEDLFTTQAPVVYDPDAGCPLFDDCLATWQPDPQVRGYLQQVAGAGATGHPAENVIVNLGDGGNGKGKFWGAIQEVLGDYAVVLHKSLIVVQRHEQHDTVKARLFGARLAVGGETEAGDRLDEAKLKELTGGDLLEARRMREDPWKFRPTHLIVLHTNHRPRVRGEDEGIWRRLRLVPWDITIPADQRDPALADKLRAEASGILNWIIAGARTYIANGNRLEDPDPVAAATKKYRDEEDHVGRFLAEACVLDEHRRVTTKRLREAYEAWCDAVGETAWTAQAIGRQLTSRGFDQVKSGDRFWLGLAIQDPEDDGDPRPTEPTQQRLDGRDEDF